MRCRLIAVLMVLMLGSACPRASIAAEEAGENAATLYRQAFGAFPKDAATLKLLDNWETAPLGAAADQAIARCEPALAWVARGAAAPKCDWGLDYGRGLALALPELNSVRPLTYAACLKVRVLCEKQQYNPALDVAGDLMALGRRLTLQQVMVSRLVGHGAEESVANAVARYLPVMPASQSAKLEARMKDLPPDVPFDQTVRNEGHMASITIRAGKPIEGAPALPTDAAGREQLAAQVESAWEQFGQLLSVPMPAVIKAHSKLAEIRQSVPPVAQAFFTDPAAVVDMEARTIEMRALFAAALSASQSGTGALSSHPDPFGRGPFVYKPVAGGFELRGSLIWKDKPVLLVTGPKAFE